MKIHIDKENKCHVSPAEGLREVDVPFFDGKCAEYIEGFCFEPVGETSGVFFPWKDYAKLEKAQLEYELAQYKANAVTVADAEAAYREGVNSVYD